MKNFELRNIVFLMITFISLNSVAFSGRVGTDLNFHAAHENRISELYQEVPLDLGILPSCQLEINKRKIQVLQGTLLAPFIGAGSTALQMGVFGQLFLLIYATDGFAQLGGIIFGMLTGVATYGAYQTYKLVQLYRYSTLERLLLEARKGEGEFKNRFFTSVLKKAKKPILEENLLKIQEKLLELDSQKSLCNGDLKSEKRKKKFEKTGKLRHGVASRGEVYRFLVRFSRENL